MKTTHLILSIPLLLLLSATGCTTDELQDKPVTNEKGEYAVNFNGNMDLTLTKASTEDVATGVKATISAYAQGATVTADAIVSHGYTVGGTAGTFVGDQEGENPFVMYLPKGEYDFYAVSTNSATTVPTFSSGVSDVLSNGVDYIWVKKDQTIGNTAQEVTLAFQRKAVRIIINVASGDGVELTAWKAAAATDNDNATITPPDPSETVKMALTDGTITPATSLTEAVNMTTTAVSAKAATATYIMLPLGSGQNPTVTLNVKVKIGNREAEEKTYSATLTAPASTSSAFTSGNQYTYTATLKANKIEFTGATVAEWGPVTGDPLTPTEP